MIRMLRSIAIATGLLLPSLGVAGPLQNPRRDGSIINAGLALYPGATPKPEPRAGSTELRTVSIEKAAVELAAAKYVSSDPPAKVLSYYRDQLKSYGTVIECGGGSNTEVSLRLNSRALSNPETCNADDVGNGQTELKAGNAREQRIVVVGLRDGGSEFTLVHVRPR